MAMIFFPIIPTHLTSQFSLPFILDNIAGGRDSRRERQRRRVRNGAPGRVGVAQRRLDREIRLQRDSLSGRVTRWLNADSDEKRQDLNQS